MTMSDRDPGKPNQASAQAPAEADDVPARENVSATTGHNGIVKVLLVGDIASVKCSASACLSTAGFSVAVASDGFEALACVVQRCPDVVLADITMPRLDGYQMCALIKSNPDYRHIPVIMITGVDGLLDEARARLVGSDAHIARPFPVQGLSEVVGTVVTRKHATDESLPRQASPANTESSGQHTV